MFRNLIFFLLPFLSLNMTGQDRFSFGLSGIYGFIPELKHSDNTSVSITHPGMIDYTIIESYEMKPGLELNFGYTRDLFKRFSLSSGIGISLNQFRRMISIEIEDTDGGLPSGIIAYPGQPVGTLYGEPGDIHFVDVDPEFNDTTVMNYPNAGETKIIYLSIPLSFQYSIVPDRFNIGIGVVNSFIAFSSQVKTRMDLNEGRFVQTEYTDRSSDGLNNYQLSGRFQIQYRVYKDLWLKTGYHHGLNPVYDEGLRMAGEAKNRQIIFGLLYRI